MLGPEMTSICRLSTFALGALAVLWIVPARSQTPAPPPGAHVEKLPVPSAAKPDFSREPSVIERYDVVFQYAADGTGSKEMTTVVHLQDESAIKGFSVLSFPFASSAEHVEIDYVRVRRADGTIVETPAADAQEMPTAITREAPFYSDLKEKQVPVRSLRAGDHLEYKVRIVRTKPEAPGHFWDEQSFFLTTNGAVVLEQSIELHVPKASYVQVWSPKYKSELAETPTERVYTWHSAQLHPIAGLDKSALHDLVAADPPDSDGNLPHIAWTNFHDWAEVGAWYRGMEGNRMTPDDDIRAKAAELIAGKKTDEEKIRAIYGYVGPQIRYIGVAFGVGRYQPHEAGDVLRNQYGDCKDKHTLLAALLSAAGFSSDAALIGSGVRFNEAVPSPGWFNHVITVAQLDGKPVWLDATAEVAPYRLLSPTLRDKQALLVPATGTAHVERTPKSLPFASEVHFDADGTLDEHGTSHSHMVMVLRGDDEVPFRQAARSVSPAQYDQLMQSISQNMSFAGTVTHAEFTRPEDTAEPFRVTYDYEREKSGDWDNYRILPQFMPIGLGAVDEKDLPISPIELGPPHVEIDHAVMKLPAGWGADLPPAIHAKSAFATLDKTYQLEEGKLITDRRFEVLQEKIPAAEWPNYKKWYTAAGLDGENFIQLTRGGGDRVAGIDDPKAADLIREAGRFAGEHNWDAAKKKLDEAKAANPNQANLWANYGYLALMYGKPFEAIQDLKRELTVHADKANVYLLLAQVQLQQRQSEDAIATLQRLLALSPDDETAIAMLVPVLLAQKDYPAAEKALRSSLKANPDSAQTQILLSTALLREGKKTEATTLLKAIAEKSDDAVILNDAAYSLADENLDLPLAEQAARRSLALVEDQIAAAPQQDLATKSLQRTSQLLAVWDTLGWTLFREGKAADAEPFVRAAWINGLDADTGYHLGMILEKEGEPVKAMATYQVALFGERGDTAEVIADANTDRQAALLKAGIKKQVDDGKMALQAQRTFKVPGPNTVTGSGTVELEFSADGASQARIIKDIQNADVLAPVVQSLNHIDYKASIPPGSKAKLVRRGVLSCHAGTPCEFVLLSTRSALSN
jgi:tetratricopeptide (TPR) repeat protein